MNIFGPGFLDGFTLEFDFFPGEQVIEDATGIEDAAPLYVAALGVGAVVGVGLLLRKLRGKRR